MAKTNPIGVRFDEEILEKIKLEQNLTSPQKVLNYLMENYCNCVLNTEKGVTVINPKNGAIIQDFTNPPKHKNIKVGKYEFPVKEVEGLGDSWGVIPQFKNDVERMFWEEEQKLKTKK